MIVIFLMGLFCGLLLPIIFSHFSYKKAHRDFEKRQEKYRKGI